MKHPDTLKLCDLKPSTCTFFWITPEQLVLATEGSLQTKSFKHHKKEGNLLSSCLTNERTGAQSRLPSFTTPMAIWEIKPSMQIWKQCQTLFFWGSKITADGDCSHEIKICLFLGRKVMTNLDRIFKSRDITWPTKVHLIKAIVFPVVMYGCESCTVKKN